MQSPISSGRQLLLITRSCARCTCARMCGRVRTTLLAPDQERTDLWLHLDAMWNLGLRQPANRSASEQVVYVRALRGVIDTPPASLERGDEAFRNRIGPRYPQASQMRHSAFVRPRRKICRTMARLSVKGDDRCAPGAARVPTARQCVRIWSGAVPRSRSQRD